MKIYGMTMKEWFAFGIGSAVNGALIGALTHNLFFLVLNGLCLGVNLYYFNTAEDDNGSDNR